MILQNLELRSRFAPALTSLGRDLRPTERRAALAPAVREQPPARARARRHSAPD